MPTRLNVFISSTSRDLGPYRDAVTRVILRLGLHPIIMEAFNPTDRNALQLCYDKVQEADLFIGIYAHRYGYAPGPEVAYRTVDGQILSGDQLIGITHLEYQWAIVRQLPMLLFVISETDAHGEPLIWDHREGEPGLSRLRAFKDLIMSKHVVGFFHSPDHLAAQVATGLAEYLRALWERTSHENNPRTSVIINERGEIGERASFSRDFYKHIPLPANYVTRADILEALRAQVLGDHAQVALTSAIKGATALHGMGGIGKSVIARALCEDHAVQAAFRDGILWTTLGQSPNLIAKLREWIGALGGVIAESAPTLESLRALLIDLLEHRACLLIVDDVWERKHVEAFQAGGEQCRLLITTRDIEVARAIGASVQPIPTMSQPEAIALLEKWAKGALDHTDPEVKLRIVGRLGRLPLAIKLAGAQLQRRSPEQWLERFNARRLAAPRVEEVHDSLERTFELSLEVLEAHQRGLYAALAIFKEDEPILEQTIVRLWAALQGLDDYEAEIFLDDLEARALLEIVGSAYPRAVVLHDLLRDFMLAELPDAASIHRALLDAYHTSKTGDGWHTAPDDGYLYDHLVYHLKAIDKTEELLGLFDSQAWMRARVGQSDYVYDRYLEDLDITLKSVLHPAVEQQIRQGADLTALPRFLRLALIRGSVQRLLWNYTPEMVKRAFEVGLWSEKRALSVAKGSFEHLFVLSQATTLSADTRATLENLLANTQEPHSLSRIWMLEQLSTLPDSTRERLLPMLYTYLQGIVRDRRWAQFKERYLWCAPYLTPDQRMELLPDFIDHLINEIKPRYPYFSLSDWQRFLADLPDPLVIAIAHHVRAITDIDADDPRQVIDRWLAPSLPPPSDFEPLPPAPVDYEAHLLTEMLSHQDSEWFQALPLNRITRYQFSHRFIDQVLTHLFQHPAIKAQALLAQLLKQRPEAFERVIDHVLDQGPIDVYWVIDHTRDQPLSPALREKLWAYATGQPFRTARRLLTAILTQDRTFTPHAAQYVCDRHVDDMDWITEQILPYAQYTTLAFLLYTVQHGQERYFNNQLRRALIPYLPADLLALLLAEQNRLENSDCIEALCQFTRYFDARYAERIAKLTLQFLKTIHYAATRVRLAIRLLEALPAQHRQPLVDLIFEQLIADLRADQNNFDWQKLTPYLTSEQWDTVIATLQTLQNDRPILNLLGYLPDDSRNRLARWFYEQRLTDSLIRQDDKWTAIFPFLSPEDATTLADRLAQLGRWDLLATLIRDLPDHAIGSQVARLVQFFRETQRWSFKMWAEVLPYLPDADLTALIEDHIHTQDDLTQALIWSSLITRFEGLDHIQRAREGLHLKLTSKQILDYLQTIRRGLQQHSLKGYEGLLPLCVELLEALHERGESIHRELTQFIEILSDETLIERWLTLALQMPEKVIDNGVKRIRLNLIDALLERDRDAITLSPAIYSRLYAALDHFQLKDEDFYRTAIKVYVGLPADQQTQITRDLLKSSEVWRIWWIQRIAPTVSPALLSECIRSALTLPLDDFSDSKGGVYWNTNGKLSMIVELLKNPHAPAHLLTELKSAQIAWTVITDASRSLILDVYAYGIDNLKQNFFQGRVTPSTENRFFDQGVSQAVIASVVDEIETIMRWQWL